MKRALEKERKNRRSWRGGIKRSNQGKMKNKSRGGEGDPDKKRKKRTIKVMEKNLKSRAWNDEGGLPKLYRGRRETGDTGGATDITARRQRPTHKARRQAEAIGARLTNEETRKSYPPLQKSATLKK